MNLSFIDHGILEVDQCQPLEKQVAQEFDLKLDTFELIYAGDLLEDVTVLSSGDEIEIRPLSLDVMLDKWGMTRENILFSNDIDKISQALLLGLDPNHNSCRNNTPLLRALSIKEEIAKLLIDHGANIHVRTSSGSTTLARACSNNMIGLIDVLIKLGLDIDDSGEYVTPLCRAANSGHLECVKTLIKKGADINARSNYRGRTAIMSAACEEDNQDVIEYLIKKGADIDAKDDNGKSSLDYALDCYENIDILLKHGARFNIKMIEDSYALKDYIRSKLY